jgi:2-haloacid dehalogenase
MLAPGARRGDHQGEEGQKTIMASPPAPRPDPVGACVFDAYGTLLDVHAAVGRHSARIGAAGDGAGGGKAAALSALWRAKQLEYSWILSQTGDYEDFEALTERALDFGMAAHGIADPGLRQALLASYRALDAFPDAAPTLAALRAKGVATAILSNGSPGMLAAAVGAAGLAPWLDAVLSVDDLRIYKPTPRVYALAAMRFGCAPRDIVFISGNAWDAYGAARFGCRVYWLNRTPHNGERQPDEYGLDRLAEGLIASLAELPDRIL